MENELELTVPVALVSADVLLRSRGLRSTPKGLQLASLEQILFSRQKF